MTTEEIQKALDEAERLHEAGAGVYQGTVGSIILNGELQKCSPQVWLALRAILIGRGFSVQAAEIRERRAAR